jgi:peptidoglycan/xylan/chitin deacetylase (PgdA/CDA1 family)
MAKKSSFNLKRYRNQTGAICRPDESGVPGELECGTRDALDDRKRKLSHEQIFDDEIMTRQQRRAEERAHKKGLLTSVANRKTTVAAIPTDPSAENAAHYFSTYRIQRTHLTVSSFGLILMVGVWLSVIMAQGSTADDYQPVDPEYDYLIGMEYIAPEADSPDAEKEVDVPDTGGEAGQGSDNENDNTVNNTGTSGNGETWAPLPLNDGTNKYIAFTFDDGPSPATTPRLLDILARENVPATFFVLGNLTTRNPQIVARAAAAGHVIGSHSWAHANLGRMSSGSIVSDLTKTSNAIKAATGAAPTLLRPPYGATSRTLQNSAGLPLILWSVDTRDWESRNTNSIYNVAVRNIRNGSIVLFHDIYPTTVAAVDRLIPALKKAGYTFVTVPELLGQPLQNGRIYYSGGR